jgi:hypothetical protein
LGPTQGPSLVEEDHYMNLYTAARVVQTIKSLSSPKRAVRRAKNIVVGRTLGRLGFWRLLWK